MTSMTGGVSPFIFVGPRFRDIRGGEARDTSHLEPGQQLQRLRREAAVRPMG